MPGDNQYYDFKGFLTPYTPPPLKEMLEMAKANKQSEMTAGNVTEELQTQEPVLRGADTEAQRSFEQGLVGEAGKLRDAYAQGTLSPMEFEYKVNQLKAKKTNDLGYKTRTAGYASALEANKSLRTLATQGKLGPGAEGTNYSNMEWNSAQDGIFSPTPKSYVPYDISKDWTGISTSAVLGPDGQPNLLTDANGNSYTETAYPNAANTAAINAEKMLSDQDGKQYIDYVKSLNPTAYKGMSDRDVAYKIQKDWADGRGNRNIQRIPDESDYSTGNRHSNDDGTGKQPEASFQADVPGMNVTIDPYVVNNENVGDDGAADLNYAHNYNRNSYSALKATMVQGQDGQWLNKDGTPADAAKVHQLEELKFQTKLAARNETEILTAAAKDIGNGHIVVNTKQDPLTGETVVDNVYDVESEQQRLASLQKNQLQARSIASKIASNTPLSYEEKFQLAQLGLDDPTDTKGTNLQDPNAMLNTVRTLQQFAGDPTVATKLAPNMSKEEWHKRNPGKYREAFNERVKTLAADKYQPMLDEKRTAETWIKTLNTGTTGDKIPKQIQELLDKDTFTYSQYFNDQNDRVFDDEGNADRTGPQGKGISAFKKQLLGFGTDPNSGDLVAWVNMAPKGAKATDEPNWSEAKRVMVKLGDHQDDLLRDQYPGVPTSDIKDLAHQLIATKNYSYSGNTTIQLDDKTQVPVVANTNSGEVKVRKFDPFTGEVSKKDGKEGWNTYTSVFEASAALAKAKQSRANMAVIEPRLSYGLEQVESDGGRLQTNSDSTATGKHQMMWTDVAGKLATEYMKDKGIIAKTATAEEAKSKYLSDPELQDKFFKEKWAPTLYKESKDPNLYEKAKSYNKWAEANGQPIVRDLTDLMALNHFLGITDLNTFLGMKHPNKYEVKGNNLSPFQYLSKFQDATP